VSGYAVGCIIGLTLSTLSDGQYRLRWSFGKYDHDILLAVLQIYKSVNMKPILQSTVIDCCFTIWAVLARYYPIRHATRLAIRTFFTSDLSRL